MVSPLSFFTDDKGIRKSLKRDLKIEYQNDPEAVIIEEFGINHGEARVDVAVVNGVIHGYELKSDSDTLCRLPNQIKVYNSVLDKVTLVVGKHHVYQATLMIPDWWGIMIAKQANIDYDVELLEIRPSSPNPTIDNLSLANLLWKSEALDILKRSNLARGIRSKTKKVLYERLASSLDQNTLKNEVRKKLCSRVNWRFER